LLAEVQAFARSAESALSDVYPAAVCHEWLGTYVDPMLSDLTKSLDKANLVLASRQ
jgi:hypothetical protein